jgi:hypothetical protein
LYRRSATEIQPDAEHRAARVDEQPGPAERLAEEAVGTDYGFSFFFHVRQPRTPIIDEALDATA